MPVMEEAEEIAEPEPFDPDASAVGSVNGNNASGKQNGAMQTFTLDLWSFTKGSGAFSGISVAGFAMACITIFNF